MKKITFFVICICILGFSSLSFGDDLGFTKVFTGAKRAPVTFNHLSHLKQDCVGCHTERNAAGGVTKDLGHKFCKSCHKSVGGEAPTKCAGCHVK